ncbi:formin isoform X3 [Tachysurus fulvidraco]|nr:formin isoform X3 [Tachysurus fulvidraco]
MDGDLNNMKSEYNNDVYIVAWTTGESGDLQYDIQLRSLTMSSTKLGILVSNEIMKNSYLSFEFGFFKKLEDVMHQANILSLKNMGIELSIPHTHYSEHLDTVMKSLHILEGDLYQNIQRVLKQDRTFAKYSKIVDRIRHLQMEYMSLKTNAAWTQELDTIPQKCINQFICQKNQVDLTNIRFNIQPKGRNIFARSVLTHLFRSYSTGNVLLLVSPCSSGISLLQPSIPFMLRDYRKSRRMFHFQCDNSAVDSSNMTFVTLTLSVNEQNSPVPVIVSFDEGEDIRLLYEALCVFCCQAVDYTNTHIHTDFLRIISAEKGTTSDPITSPNLSPENEERTPGRLQAVWPPPKSKDEEEKIGLKYTEAEHQAALLHLKRECKEEQEALEADFKLQLYHLRDENEETVSRLQAVIADLKSAANCSHRELRDAAVSTEDYFTPRIFRTVCIQTDRETFIKPVKAPEISKDLCPQPNVPKKLDLASIASNLSSKPEHAVPQLLPLPTPQPLSVQSGLDSVTTSNPLSLSGPSESYSKPAQTDKFPPLRQASCPPPPPPPPPIILAGLAPPPPLLGPVPTPPSGSGLFSGAEERLQRKPRVEPVCPMKPLYWTRIQIQDSRNDTLWSLLKEPGIINTDEFAELFAKMASPAKRKPLSEAYDNTAKAKKIIKVLDSKRSQAVGILISSLHLEMKDIQQAILMMDNSVVDLDAIEALYETRAQPEELEKIRKHYESSDEEHVRLLDKPEQFLYELSLIPQFSLRARCIILQSTFTDAVASVQRKANTVLHVCKGLLERDSVREVLGLVLACGNYMNGGSRHRGQADGFGLDILPKLKDVKSRDNNISLVDYIVSYYLHNLDENAGTENCVFPLPEPQDVFLASQVKFEDLSKELRKLGEDLEGCETDIQSVWLTSPQEYIYPFKEKMESFILSAQNEKIATENHLMSAQKCFRDLVQYFGMKPYSGEQDVLPGHVFMLWFEFCNDFKTRWKKENKAISNERLKEAQQLVRNLTADKKVETRQVHANGLKERLRLKEASLSST